MARNWIGVFALFGLIACSNGNGGGVPGGPIGGAAPIVVAVFPESGFTSGGTEVTITGSNFLGAGTVTVRFGTEAGLGVNVQNDTTLTVMTPVATTSGGVDVAVTTDDGTGTLPSAFTLVRFPVVARVPDMRLDASANATPFGFPQICCDGERVYAVWHENRSGGANANDVFFRASADGGATWSAEQRVNTNAAGASDSIGPRICCDGERVYVVYVDDRNGTYEPFVNRSLDGGATFLASDIRVSSTTPGSANAIFFPQICCDGDVFAISWSDDRNAGAPLGAADIFANVSTDAGATWQAVDSRINSGVAPGVTPRDAILSTTRMCCEGSTVLVTWSSTVGDGNVWFQRSTDAGATWQAAETRINTSPGSTAAYPRMCCVGQRVYVGFVDDRFAAAPGAAFDVFVNSSDDGGATFRAADVRVSTFTPGLINAGNIELCCEGSAVYLTWRDDRNGSFGEDIFFNRSLDGGATFDAADTRINTGVAAGSTPRTALPKICCGNGVVHIVWGDARNGRSDLFSKASDDGGATWPASDARLDTDAPGASEALFVQTCCGGPVAYFIWRDDRNAVGSGNFDVFFNAIAP